MMPQTLIEAVRHFSDPETCHAFMVQIWWGDGPATCRHCGSENVRLCIVKGKAPRRVYQCNACRKQFTTKTGTIFEDSPLPMEKWLPAVWMIAGAKNGISSYEVSRAIGVTQKTAWHMMHRIRTAMASGSFVKMSGQVEVDETFIGGLAKNMHRAKREAKITGRGASGKEIVVGVLERGHTQKERKANTKAGKPSKYSRVKVTHALDTSAKTLHGQVKENVEPNALVCTDQFPAYHGLAPEYIHASINHLERYAAGIVHTCGIDNYWSLLKRTIKGTYVSVDAAHLAKYLDEQAFRFNERTGTDADRFVQAMRQVLGKRLTYAELTGAAGEAKLPN